MVSSRTIIPIRTVDGGPAPSNPALDPLTGAPHAEQAPHVAHGPAPLPANGKQFHIWTIGCQMNEADSAKVASLLQEVGYRQTANEQDADIVVLNSCVVRQAAEDKVAGKLGSLARLKRDRPEAKVVLTGCMVTNQQEQLRKRFPHVDLFFDPSDFDRLGLVVPELARLEDDLAELPHYYAPSAEDTAAAEGYRKGVTAFVPIIYGCNFLCSYCIVPYRRGRETSRPMGSIVREVERLVADGVREVTLLGQTVNAWGHDLAEKDSLANLLRAVDAIPGLERLRYLTSHPMYMTDELFDTMAELPSLCEHLNLPVQAGDNEVLRRMRRRYSRDLWLERLGYARGRMPDLTVATDIIVGFPGETEEQFLQTYAMLEEARCEKVHLAMYSPRPGTLSARWEDDIPHAEKHRRHQALEKLQERIGTEINAGRLGTTTEVLVEGRNKGRWSGRSRGNTLVHIDAPEDADLLGKLVDVRITTTGPWYVIGEPIGAPVR
ncbi:MAG TPA: tRNA (N6-isopentenyl adenosine(37)-C2)-methylthiotransferase MiaB [Thermomicrobiales bacterium]|jgi:tRNA-2-methylthio-N6-dimethylallyladenosine synthase|nr:tRNA (N6-isopentenyl adenosine(37)-C2)-methylthiotransferase MiaB [Thermomicrobiales bacterium]